MQSIGSHSTVFEVQLASYYELTSGQRMVLLWQVWMDYPPFFAYFEYLLSVPASFADRQIVNVTNFNYASDKTVNY